VGVKAIDRLAELRARARRKAEAARAERAEAAGESAASERATAGAVAGAASGAGAGTGAEARPSPAAATGSRPVTPSSGWSAPVAGDTGAATGATGSIPVTGGLQGHFGVDEPVPSSQGPDLLAVDAGEGAGLWERLRENPNEVDSFHRLAEIVRRRAGEGHVGGDQQRAADDAVWALAEELAHNSRAWYPLIELARLSVHDDRDAALRRLATAADRDPSGRALATGLAMLREAQLPSDALGLGVAHWRPREHDLEAGRHLVLAAVESGRIGDARRHLDALSAHPDAGRVAELRAELEGLIAQLEAERAAGRPMTNPAGIPVTGPLIDLRETDLRKTDLRKTDVRDVDLRRGAATADDAAAAEIVAAADVAVAQDGPSGTDAEHGTDTGGIRGIFRRK
jgi:hypothetical protein